MALLAMPLVVTNLGCEMLYILQQRLVAQNIPTDKSVKVLHDVVRAMFEPSFVSQLFVPQTVFTVQSTRTIFDKLAHSSIMRLSEASMDKLFDLMMMGVKFQLLCCKEPLQFVKVTLTHLRQVQKIIQSDGDQFTANLYSKVETTYSSLNNGQWELLRQKLCAFFQDKRVKVSLFLQEGIQNSLGSIIMPSPAMINRNWSAGEVTIFKPDGAQKMMHKLDALNTNPDEFFQHPLELGSDLYDKARPRVTPPKRHIRSWSKAQSRKKSSEKELQRQPPASHQSMPQQQAEKSNPPPAAHSKPARSEATLLASLMSRPVQNDKMKLNLMFDDPMMDIVKDTVNGTEGAAESLPKFKTVKPIQANTTSPNSYKDGLLGDLSGLNIEVTDSGKDGDDLLDLLDGIEADEVLR